MEGLIHHIVAVCVIWEWQHSYVFMHKEITLHCETLSYLLADKKLSCFISTHSYLVHTIHKYCYIYTLLLQSTYCFCIHMHITSIPRKWRTNISVTIGNLPRLFCLIQFAQFQQGPFHWVLLASPEKHKQRTWIPTSLIFSTWKENQWP